MGTIFFKSGGQSQQLGNFASKRPVPAAWREKAAATLCAVARLRCAPARVAYKAVGLCVYAVYALGIRLNAFGELLDWMADASRSIAAAPNGWAGSTFY